MTAKQQFQNLVNDFVQMYRPRVKVAKLGSMPVLMVDGRPFVGFWRDTLTLRLSGDARQRVLKLKGKPVGMVSGKMLDEWVDLPVVQVNHWRPLAEQAMREQGREEA